jgi:hypothetical protein
MEKLESDSESTFEEDNIIIEQLHKPVSNIRPITNEHKLRQLLTQIDIKDYDLKNPVNKNPVNKNPVNKNQVNKNQVNKNQVNKKKNLYLKEKDIDPLKVYIYGDYPHYQKSGIYFMLNKAGVIVNRKLNEVCDIGLLWDPRIDIDKHTPKLKQNSKKVKMINLFLKDTSKDFIATEFEKFFGYSYQIDPAIYDGYCIGKHNGNGTKSCFFLKCPINANEIFKDYSYQKIIDYTDISDSDTLYELRVPIIGGIIPYVLFKTRSRGLRFTSKNRSIEIVKPLMYLTENECNQIITFCSSIGLELGEIDILRSNENGKIYIIDVNNTSWWPANKLGDVDRNIVLNLMWNSFLEAFLPKYYKNYHIPDNLIDDFTNCNNENENRLKVSYRYNENRFVYKQYKMEYKVTWRNVYNNDDTENNEKNEKNENDENYENDEKKDIINLKINEEHLKKMNELFEKNPHLKKMFINKKMETERKHKENWKNEQQKQLEEQQLQQKKLLEEQQLLQKKMLQQKHLQERTKYIS